MVLTNGASPVPLFTLEEVAVWVTIISTAVGALVLFGRFAKDWIEARWKKTHDLGNVDVEKMKVKVTEREAQTHEIAVILEGFTAVTAASTARAESAEKSAEHAHLRVEKVENRLTDMERINDEMIDHIKLLEGMVPNPPGPPTRPTWRV